MAEARAFEAPPIAQGLGELVWSPPAEILERARVAGRRRLGMALRILALAFFAFALAGASIVWGTIEVAGLFAAVAALLFLLGAWAFSSVKEVGAACLAVFKGGVLMPSSFASVPGLETFAGPRSIPLSEIARAEDMRRPEGRAIVVWTQGGTGAFVAERVGAVRLTPMEQEHVLDSFLGALRSLGVKVRSADNPPSGTPAEPEWVAPAPAEG